MNDVWPTQPEDREGRFGLRATIDRAPIGMAHFDSSGRFLLVNDRLCEILGYTRDELLERTFQQITFPDDLPACLALTAQVAAGEQEQYQIDKRFVRGDGSSVWTRITVSAVRRSDGGVAFFIGIAEDISVQVAMEEARRGAEERLRMALDASQIATFRFDVRRNALDWADGLEPLFGNVQNTTLEQFFAMIHPDDRARIMESYVAAARDGGDFEEEFRVIWPDGSTHWLHDRGRTFAGSNGEPHYILGAITDITNHKRMEQVIRERNAQFRTLANAIPQLAWMADCDGRRFWFNDRWYEFTGYGLDEMRDFGWMRVHDADAAESVRTGQLDAFRSGTVWEDTVRLRGGEGGYRWFLSRAMPVHDASGQVIQWVGTDTDITDRLDVERTLREREDRFRKALDVDNIGVIFFDNEHRITGVNRAFTTMSGYSSEMAAGLMIWRDLTPAEWRSQAERHAAEFDAAGRTTPYEQEYIRRDGSRWWGLFTATRLSPHEGVKFVLDISERKRTEAEREQLLQHEQAARAQAERAMKLREEVLAFVAHDLRNPVQTIVMAASAIRELALSEEQRMRQLAIIERSAWRMDRLIGDLLDVSRMEAGTFAVRRERVAVHGLIQEVLEGFEAQARARGVSLTSTVDARIPALTGDRQRLIQVLSNLIANAVKFTAPGGRVCVRARQMDWQIEMSVQDSGCGIAPEQLAKVFERFWQADRVAGGAGLGLVIARGIVEAHGGRIGVESVLGRGTTFRVLLPLAERDHSRIASSRSA